MGYMGYIVHRSTLRRLTIPLEMPGSSRRLVRPRALMHDEAEHGSFMDFPVINPSARCASVPFIFSTHSSSCAHRPLVQAVQAVQVYKCAPRILPVVSVV